MKQRSLGRKLVVAALTGALATSGCTKTVTRQFALYQPGQNPTSQPVRDAAVYKVKVFDDDGSGKLHGIDGTERVLIAGDVVGFRTDEAGVVHATASDAVFPLKLAPNRKVVWYTSYQKKTQFGKEVGKAMETTGEVAMVAALVGLTVFALAAEANHDDCDQHP